MKKIALFVEGLTEQTLVFRLLIEIAGRKNIRIDRIKAFGGATSRRSFRVIEAEAHSGQSVYVLLRDCGSDSRVASDIRDNYDGLIRQGYTSIIGLRDVIPHSRLDIPRIKRFINYGVKTVPVTPEIHLAVMEVEAWFLAECTHFSRIDIAITPELILERLGFDPRVDDMTLRDAPAVDLRRCYAIAGKSYQKDRAHIERTVNALDLTSMCLEVGERISHLNVFLKSLDLSLAV